MIHKINHCKEFNLNDLNSLADISNHLLIVSNEEKYHAQLERIAENLIDNIYEVSMLLLTGPSSAGKTISSKLLKQLLESKGITTHVVSQDNFFIDKDKSPLLPDGTHDLESVECIDFDAYHKFLEDLEKKDKVSMPIFDFTVGKRSPERIEFEITDTTLIIMEGIHAINPRLSEKTKNIKKAYINTDKGYCKDGKQLLSSRDVRLLRRSIRDLYSRKNSIEDTINYWKVVCAGEDKYITPFKDLVDYNIHSSIAYEIFLYAKYLLPLLEINNINSTTQHIINVLKDCPKWDKSMVPLNSILQEFIEFIGVSR